MVRLLLSIKAELENITDLEPASDDFDFFFKVKCNSCHEDHPKFVSLNRRVFTLPLLYLPILNEESFDLPGSKGNTANFVWRCGYYELLADRAQLQANAKARLNSRNHTHLKLINAENGQFGPLLQIECRGLEFTDFDPRGTWKCKGLKGTPFEVELEDKEWNDYDEKAALPVGVSDFGSQWTKAH